MVISMGPSFHKGGDTSDYDSGQNWIKWSGFGIVKRPELLDHMTYWCLAGNEGMIHNNYQ